MRRPLIAIALVIAAACSKAPEPDPVPVIVPEPAANVRVAPSEQPVAPGDCEEAMRRAVAKPDLNVDRIPTPISAKPAPLVKPPASALRRDGSADVKVDVLVDTLGRADMKTFRVVSTSSPWLATNVKSVISKWTFSPAQLAGCKIPRVYHFIASAPPRRKK